MAVVEDWTPSMTTNATPSAPAEGVSYVAGCGLNVSVCVMPVRNGSGLIILQRSIL